MSPSAAEVAVTGYLPPGPGAYAVPGIPRETVRATDQESPARHCAVPCSVPCSVPLALLIRRLGLNGAIFPSLPECQMLRVGECLVRTISPVLVLVQSFQCLGPSVPSCSSSLSAVRLDTFAFRPPGLVSRPSSPSSSSSFFPFFSHFWHLACGTTCPQSSPSTTKKFATRDLALSHADEPMKYLLASACTTTTTTTTLAQKH
ncbi:hypothetical protein B0T20DRAFT_499533 [Sordaria brevicollis]|uniref:Uncharacterized protein n=1 Tax=Sordaria brevicollis TaxID=83679 RepID=A0AAE0UB85_SORBR|nr:hypothetical protein B0T20DRAFT_499533 [Sordaria brevicollis]